MIHDFMILGHERTIRQLQKLGDAEQLFHGYIFFGPPGTGKRSVAEGLASYLEQGKWDKEGVLVDATVMGPSEEAQTIGIDEVRGITRFLWQKPFRSRYRTAIVDRAELLTTEAQNALLKIAEEPLPSTLIMLVVRDLDDVLPTIQSRFHKLYFGTVPEANIKAWLMKEHRVAARDAEEAARRGGGAPGRALAFLNDPRTKAREETVEEFVSLSPAKKSAFLKSLIEKKDFDFDAFLEAFLVHFSSRRDRATRAGLFHHACDLRRTLRATPLNPRLQLEYLWTLTSKN